MRIVVAAPRCIGISAPALAGLPGDLAFCHPSIRRVVSIDRDGGTIELDVDADSDDLRKQVDSVVELSVRSYRFVQEQKALWTHDAFGRYRGGTTAIKDFVRRHVVELGPGQYALTGPAARLRNAVDDKLRGIAEAIDAEPWHVPAIGHTADVIVPTKYLASHGQHVTFGYRLPCHFETLRAFATDAREQAIAAPRRDELVSTEFILEPFACHNMFRVLRNSRVDGFRSITALGRCFRHEGFRFEPLLRQWEFSVREIVLVGPPDQLAAQRTRVIELAQRLARELDLDARLVIATDPFFVSEAASQRTYQAMNSTKLEFELALDRDRRTAAASFNFHGKHFSEPLRITDADGSAVDTACIGLGLERWMAAIIARWGVDHARWPI